MAGLKAKIDKLDLKQIIKLLSDCGFDTKIEKIGGFTELKKSKAKSQIYWAPALDKQIDTVRQDEIEKMFDVKNYNIVVVIWEEAGKLVACID